MRNGRNHRRLGGVKSINSNQKHYQSKKQHFWFLN